MTGLDSSCFGYVVQSKAGRDKKRLFITVGVSEDGRVLTVNGALHGVLTPKKKNPRHLKLLGKLSETQLSKLRSDFTDRCVRELISGYNVPMPKTEN